MGVQEGQHLPAGHAGPQQPGRYQPLPLLLPHHPHDLQLLHVVLQLILQVVWGGVREGGEPPAPGERGCSSHWVPAPWNLGRGFPGPAWTLHSGWGPTASLGKPKSCPSPQPKRFKLLKTRWVINPRAALTRGNELPDPRLAFPKVFSRQPGERLRPPCPQLTPAARVHAARPQPLGQGPAESSLGRKGSCTQLHPVSPSVTPRREHGEDDLCLGQENPGKNSCCVRKPQSAFPGDAAC